MDDGLFVGEYPVGNSRYILVSYPASSWRTRTSTLGKTGNGETSLQQQQMEGKRIPPYEAFDEKNRALLDHWASWDSYRLSQLTADAFSIRKRAKQERKPL